MFLLLSVISLRALSPEIIPGEGIKQVKIGMGYKEVLKNLGKPTFATLLEHLNFEQWRYQVNPEGLIIVNFSRETGRVKTLFFEGVPGMYVTIGGKKIKMGSSWKIWNKETRRRNLFLGEEIIYEGRNELVVLEWLNGRLWCIGVFEPPGKMGARKVNEKMLVLFRKILASPDDYVGKDVKLHLCFGSFLTAHLDMSRPYYPSDRYVEFSAFLEDAFLDRFFIRKSKAELLYHLKSGSPITIYGVVKSSAYNFPWIEVNRIEEGWK